MRLQLAILFGLALTAQLVNAAWHGFDPVEDGLQLASAATLSLLILRFNRVRSQRRKALMLRQECERMRCITRELVETIRRGD